MGTSVSPLAGSVDDDRSDAELISAVRAGDVAAYGELFARHVDAARRLGRQLVSGPDVDDLVSEAFAKVLGVLQRGGGPDLAFRAYLLTAVRRLHVDRIRAGARLHTTDDLTPFDPGVPFRDTAVEHFESVSAARAFASLPERWQLVLWHTEVEGQRPAEVAPLLGMSPNSVSALAYRAREGLRQAYLAQHAQSVEDDACQRTRALLGGYVRGGLSRRDTARVEQHLDECRACAAICLELTEVNSDLRGLLAPLLLGGLAAAYLGSASGAAAAAGGMAGGVLGLLGQARETVLTHASTAAVAAAAAAAVVAGTVVTMQQSRPDPAAVEPPLVQVLPAGTPASGSPRQVEVERAGRMIAARGSASATAAPATRPTAPASPSTPATADSPSPTRSSASPGPGSSTPASPPPASPTSSPAPVSLEVSASAGADGVHVGVTAGVLGITLPPIDLDLPGE